MKTLLHPCPFCRQLPLAYSRTCDKTTPYNPSDRAFPQVRCRCGSSVDGDDWTSVETAIKKWNERAAPSADLLAALTQLAFMARTSGTPTPELLRACEGAEALIATTGGCHG